MKFEKVHDDYHDRQVAALTPDYDLVPAHLQYGIREYIQRGNIPGDFLQAIIRSDLSKAFAHADGTTMAHMDDIVKFMWNEAPGQCWGDKAKMDTWAKAGGLEGAPEGP